jgi:Leucine-rich repeat (LRR) protein
MPTVEEKIQEALNTNATELDLSDMRLTTLPDSIGNLTNLTELYVGWNHLTTLPDSIGNLTNLTKLNVRGNQLTTLPDSIGNLTNLEQLFVSYNQLTTLPDSIGNLTNLNTLYVNDNQLTTLPDSIGNLTNFNLLRVRENENLAIRRSLLNSMENNGIDIEMDNNITIIEDVQENVPEARPLPQGIAYEVHREFQKTYQTMLENFRIMGQYLGNYGIQDIQGFTLQNKYSSTEMNLLYSFMNYFVHEKYNGDKNKNELVTKIDSIFDKIKDSSFDTIGTEYIVNVKTTLLFISKVNNPIMINYYVEAFIEDCIQAYGQGSGNTSCVLGIQERFVLTFNIMFRSVCCQQKMCANDNISQDVLDIMCPVNKDMIIEAISKKEPSNSYIQQWSMNETYEETYKNQNESQRKEHVVDYLTNQFTEGIQDTTIKSEIRNEIANKINKMIDEKKANFTCNDLFEVFTNPSGCDSTPSQQGGMKKKKGKKKTKKGKKKMPTVEEKIKEALCTNATELNVAGNQLTTLPDWIGILTNLHTLRVQKNQLTTLPDSIGNLTNLKKLIV